MNWITFVAASILADVFRVFLDNYITDVYFKERHGIAQRLFYGIFYIVLAIALIVIFGIDFSTLPPLTFFLFFLSGVFSSLAGIPYYRALERDDSTNLGIFFQFAPVLYLLANWLIFNETISAPQIISIPIILAAPILIVATTSKRSRNIRLKTMLLILLSMTIEVIGSLIFVHSNSPDISFTGEIIPVFFGHGLANALMILVYRKWRKRFFDVVKSSKRKVYFPMLFDAVASAAKTIAYRAALVLAPTVALASAASDAITPIAIFFAGIVLTLIWPNFGREKLNRKTVRVHLIATILIIIGIIIMQS